MSDLVFEMTRVIVLCLLTGMAIHIRPSKVLVFRGDGWIIGGFALLTMGSALDVTDNFPHLSRYVVVGETQVQAILEEIVGYLGGLICLLVGIAQGGISHAWMVEKIERLKETEAQIDQSNAFLNSLLNSIPAVIFFKDRDGRMIGCNDTYEQVMGIRREELVGRTVHDIFPKAKADRFVRYDRQVMETGQSVSYETVVPKADGTEMNALVHKASFRNADGSIGGIIGVSTDISARKGMELALRLSEERFRRMSELSNEAMFLHKAGVLVDCNQAALKLFGYSYEEMMTKKNRDLIAEEFLESVRAQVEQQSGESFEAEAIRKDGSRFPVAVSAKSSNLGDDNIRVTFMVDITARKQAEEQLRKLSKAVEQNPAVIQITDPNGIIEYVNPKFCEITGYSIEEAVGSKPSLLKSGYTTDEEYAVLWQTITAGGTWTGELCNRKKNGELFWERAAISSVVDDSGEITHFVATKEDITDYKRAEAELLAAKEKAEMASRAKSEFLANMSHELRTPLNAIIGFSEVMEKELHGPLGDERYKDYLGDIRNSGDHLLQLINDILDLSKIEAGEFRLMEDELDLRKLLDAALMIIRPRLTMAHHSLRVELPDDLPRIVADARAIKQILINLLTNAIKFTPDGGEIVIAVERKEGGDLVLSVQDNGIGIPADRIEEVMQPFTQVENAFSRQAQGTGLGLSITRKLTELHDGKLELISDVGQGVTAVVYFPPSKLLDVGQKLEA